GEGLDLDLEANPQMASSPEVGFRIAGWFWKTNNINRYADKGDIRAVTLKVNAGRATGEMPERAHFALRKEYYQRALKALENFEVVVPNGNGEPTIIKPVAEEKPLATGY